MARKLSPAQRKAVAGSDPETGRVTAPAQVCSALAAAGLAVPHGRGGHHSYYLTTEGRRLREALARGPEREAAPDADDSGPAASAAASGTSFTADDGTGAAPAPPPSARARRAADVATAWEGLLQIRALLGDGATGVPAAWERDRPVHAVALALEAAGAPPARPDSPGYRVAASSHPGLTEVTWSEPSSAQDALERCAWLLRERGWQPTEHRTRTGEPFLLTSPAAR